MTKPLDDLVQFFAPALEHWHVDHGRHHLPWSGKGAYHTWISEIMLQQTQVVTVIPYYHRFIESFSNPKALAEASDDSLLAHWKGLGYYRRALNLRRSAQVILEQHNGAMPVVWDHYLALPGIGPSTASAIISLAFNANYPIFDGNVRRILARLTAFEEPINTGQSEKHIRRLAELLMNKTKKPSVYTQAIMDFGATVCTPRQVKCNQCPFTKHCQAYQRNKVLQLPIKKKQIKKIQYMYWLFVEKDGYLLMTKQGQKEWWSYLYIPIALSTPLPNVPQVSLVHHLTHRSLHIVAQYLPFKEVLKINEKLVGNKDAVWIEAQDMNCPVPVEKLWNKFQCNNLFKA